MLGWYDAEDTHPNEVGTEVVIITYDKYGNFIKLKAIWDGERFDPGNNSKALYWRYLTRREQEIPHLYRWRDELR